ncbi:MAG: 1-deoxy-D-xylulose-5-phosphate reductoisomerase [Phycisphaeraceae bacterium]|nr:1-deoxy-D-xylulose-5-phosphate reductoisomerase [Phycisphaeraceae bacterium]
MATNSTRRRLVVLGSTGSIGVNTLNVVEHLNALADENGNSSFDVVGLAAGRKADVLVEQTRKFHVPAVAIADPQQAQEMATRLPRTRIFAGDDSALELMEHADATDCIAAVVGSAGLPAAIVAARKGMSIGLANKETLVAAGSLITPIIKKHGARLIPVDSEHSAIFQCIEGQGRKSQGTRVGQTDGPQEHSSIKRIVLTASGGPFRTASKETVENATVEQALKHPTWVMGPKITIDSATLMNKALEVIEAHWLFDLPAEKIEVIIHPQSMIHSFVEFTDNSILAQLGPPDMKTPIQYALTYPHRSAGCSAALDWSKLNRLDFEEPDHERFGALRLAYDVIRKGGTAGAIFNAANEAAVAAFLERKVRFGRITELVRQALTSLTVREVDSLETVLAADREAREFVKDQICRQ